MKSTYTKPLKYCIIFGFCIFPFFTKAQSCSGHWVNSRPYTFQCISGQLIGQSSPYGDPPGCPINPIYTFLQTNTFLFNNVVGEFFIDFNAFDSDSPGCPRMEVKINGIFYPLTASNLTDFPVGTNCFGSVSNLAITSDGYITSTLDHSNGQGRISFSGVNASNITISTNDEGGGIVVANPCLELLPINIQSFKGYATGSCEVKLEFESGIESNVRNIEVEGSFEGTSFSKLLKLSSQGSDSRYVILCKSSGNNFYRLKINDLDGRFSYSEIIRINHNCAYSPIRISPNPSSQKILVENVQRNDQLIIVDLLGRELFHVPVINNSTELNIQDLPTGLYFLKVFRKNVKVETARFVKK